MVAAEGPDGRAGAGPGRGRGRRRPGGLAAVHLRQPRGGQDGRGRLVVVRRRRRVCMQCSSVLRSAFCVLAAVLGRTVPCALYMRSVFSDAVAHQAVFEPCAFSLRSKRSAPLPAPAKAAPVRTSQSTPQIRTTAQQDGPNRLGLLGRRRRCRTLSGASWQTWARTPSDRVTWAGSWPIWAWCVSRP